MGRKRVRKENLDGLLGLHGALASSSQTQPKSALVELLMSKYLWGEIPATLVQQICGAALQDGVELPDVKAIAHVGTSGLHTGKTRGNNAKKCTHRMLSKLGSSLQNDLLNKHKHHSKRFL